MRAARFHTLGDPSVLQVDDVPAPAAPSGDQLLVRVEASSVNGTDLGLRAGLDGVGKLATLGRLPAVPGFDLAGEVVRCGPAVTAFRPGDRIMALLPHSGGGQAEQALVAQDRAARVPRSVSVAQAAALPLAGLTALQALYGKAGLQARRAPRVLVNGASGGIGSYAVQLAKIAGAHVTATASGAKLAFARRLGADEVVDYAEHDVTRSGERWDVVLDAPGRLAFADVRPVLTEDGVLVTTRGVSPDILRVLTPGPLRRGPRFAAIFTGASSQDLAHLAELVDTGRLRPMLDRTFALDEIVDAHRYAEGGVRGKVVVTI